MHPKITNKYFPQFLLRQIKQRTMPKVLKKKKKKQKRISIFPPIERFQDKHFNDG